MIRRGQGRMVEKTKGKIKERKNWEGFAAWGAPF